ncbi:hypothetical protein LINPERPRIM_LOCUS13824, partial [Linum perenne]
GTTTRSSAPRRTLREARSRRTSPASDAGVIETLISDPSLPPNSTIIGLAINSINNRLLAAIHSMFPLPVFNAIAAYDLQSRERIFLSLLPDGESLDSSSGSRPVANAIAVDYKGNAYVTNSLGTSEGNFIWKVDSQGEASIFSRSPLFTRFPADYSNTGLNGIAYLSKGYLLVVQSNTGKMFKVDEVDGEEGAAAGGSESRRRNHGEKGGWREVRLGFGLGFGYMDLVDWAKNCHLS